MVQNCMVIDENVAEHLGRYQMWKPTAAAFAHGVEVSVPFA